MGFVVMQLAGMRAIPQSSNAGRKTLPTIMSGGVSRGLEAPDYRRNENRDPVYDSAYRYWQRSVVARIHHHTPVLQYPAPWVE